MSTKNIKIFETPYILLSRRCMPPTDSRSRDFRATRRAEEGEILGRKVFGEDSRIFQIPDKFYGPPRGRFTSGYERSSEPMLTRTKDIYYPRVCTMYIYVAHHTPID